MNKPILISILFSVALFARHEAFPILECPAFNNMKHTQNSGGIHLDTKKKYTILKQHKGQNLIRVEGEQPVQRWVDEGCFSKHEDLSLHTNKYQNEKLSKQTLLALSWHNAFCETHRYKKECKRSMFFDGKRSYREKHFVLHGLWPQPQGNTYCDVSSAHINLDKHKQWNRLPDLELKDDLKARLKKVMPGFSSGLHKHEWIKHGTCYGADVNRYYEDAIGMVEQINDSKVGDFFAKHIGKYVTLQQVRMLFDRNFGPGTGKRVELKCTQGLISELWLHLGSGSDSLGTLLKQGEQTRSHCQGGLIDKAGF